MNKLSKFLLSSMIVVAGVLFVPFVVKAEDVPIDAAHFPDAKFREYVSTETDKDGNGILSAEEIDDVTLMELNDMGISELKGIEYFSKLSYLECSNNQLKSLDISQNLAIYGLECSRNQLKSLDVSKNTALEYLSCDSNQLTSLDVSKNTELNSLDCNSNQLKSLDVSKNTLIFTLNCSGNQLTSLDVSKNTALVFLSCYKNCLTSLNVSKNVALEDLKCHENKIKSLDVSNNPKIRDLFAWGNKIKTIDVSAIENLDSLYYNDLGYNEKQYQVTFDLEKKLLIYGDPDPEVKPDKTIKVGKKATFKVKKKIGEVNVSDDEIASVKKKGKKVIVTGKSAGYVTVTAYDKNEEVLGEWIVLVE